MGANRFPPIMVMFVVSLKVVVDRAGAVTHSLKTLVGNPTIIQINIRKTACPSKIALLLAIVTRKISFCFVKSGF